MSCGVSGAFEFENIVLEDDVLEHLIFSDLVLASQGLLGPVVIEQKDEVIGERYG